MKLVQIGSRPIPHIPDSRHVRSDVKEEEVPIFPREFKGLLSGLDRVNESLKRGHALEKAFESNKAIAANITARVSRPYLLKVVYHSCVHAEAAVVSKELVKADGWIALAVNYFLLKFVAFLCPYLIESACPRDTHAGPPNIQLNRLGVLEVAQNLIDIHLSQRKEVEMPSEVIACPQWNHSKFKAFGVHLGLIKHANYPADSPVTATHNDLKFVASFNHPLNLKHRLIQLSRAQINDHAVCKSEIPASSISLNESISSLAP